MFRTAYGERKRVVSSIVGESMAKQSFKNECDMNRIIAKFRKTGMIDHIRESGGRFIDVPENLDFQTAQNVMAKATSMFEELPSDLRKKFDNDVQTFMDYVNNPENEDGMRELGLLKPKAPQVVPEAGEAAAAAEAAPLADKGANAPASA
jgi:phage internal scaffolding protein